ncbi:MAG: amidase family protein [Chloroflexota bacterium]
MTLDLFAPATEQIHWLKSGEISSEALLDAYIARADEVNPALNTIVSRNVEQARQLAKSFDARRAQGEDLGSLQGLPMTLKDSYDVDGLPAVSGAPALANRPPEANDALVVQKLKAAGAIIWAKTNTPLYTGDIQTYNDVYGVTNNPYDLTRTPGGSSGGSAAALAAGLTPLEVGSDIGGSLRIPAHNCGIYSLKPTHGLLSLKGHVPPAPNVDIPEPDLAVPGPMARTPEDLALLLSILVGSSEEIVRSASLSGLRIALWQEPAFELGGESARALDDVVGIATAAGASVEIDKPLADGMALMEIYQRLLIPIVTAGLPTLTRTAFRLARPFARLLRKKGTISLFNSIVSATQSPEALRAVRRERQALKEACARFFEGYDLLIAPVTSVEAIPHNNKREFYRRQISVDGRQVKYATLYQWISLATTCHLPAVIVPMRQTAAGLPVGVQLIGPEGADQKLIAIAQRLAEVISPLSKPAVHSFS